MKAAITRYGPPDTIEVSDLAMPVPKAEEVLIEVHAASVNPLDWKTMNGGPYLLRLLLSQRKPNIKHLGVDVAGRVHAVGTKVTQFKPGDAVFGTCQGAFAEFACTSQSAKLMKPALVTMPGKVTFQQAACAPIAALTALQGLRDKGRLQPGQKVLINGAAGGVGTFAVQIARSFGAEVTGVCSTRNLDMVRSIGAHRVIDYTREDFTQAAQRYHLLFDTIGNHPLSACRRVLHPRGRLVMAGLSSDAHLGSLVSRLLGAIVLSPFLSRKMIFFIAKGTHQDLAILGEMMSAGTLTPVIDRSFPLSEVPEALRYLQQGHARGKVIIDLEHSRDT